jgi:hypothetical protein
MSSSSSSSESSCSISSSNNEDDDDLELFQLVESLSLEKNDQLLSSLQNIYHRQNEMMQILSKLSDDLERSILLIPQEMQRVDQYRSKLARVKSAMMQIDEKIQLLQYRLNKLRSSLPAISTVLMERPGDHGVDPQFYYRCVVPIGLKYRSKPSSAASIIAGKEIKYREIVAVKERVFVCKENSIFLHVAGSGWLFENEDNLRYMERVGFNVLPSSLLIDVGVKEFKNDATNNQPSGQPATGSDKAEKVTFIDI